MSDQPTVLTGQVVGVHARAEHNITKLAREAITLVEGLGVDGDVHSGPTVKHRSRLGGEPKPNLRQVHLIHAELHDELGSQGFEVGPGQMGENVTTRGIDLLGLPLGSRLRLGAEAVVEITGLRNPCKQLEGVAPGLMEATLERTPDGGLVRKAGVMSVVVRGGEVRPGDEIHVELPDRPHSPLEPV